MDARLDRPRGRLLVRRDDVEPAREPIVVVERHLSARRRVYDDGVREVLGAYVLDEPREVCPLFARRERLAPAVEVYAAVVQEHAAAVHYGAHAQVYAALRAKLFEAARELVEERAADEPRADDADRDGLPRKVEGRMHRAQRLRRLALLYDHRDVPLRRALRDGAHVDARLAERAEKLTADAYALDHALAHHREDAAALGDFDRLHFAAVPLGQKGVLDRAARELSLRLGHGEADRVLGACLRDHDDRDSGRAERAEELVRDAGHADHARPLDVDERHVLDGREALDGRRGVRVVARDARAGRVGPEGVTDVYGDAALDGGRHRVGVYDLRAEVRELGRLLIRKLRDDERVGHAARVRAHHAVHVRPDGYRVGFEQRAEDGGGEVTAVALERRRHAVGRRGDVARDDDEFCARLFRTPARQTLARAPPIDRDGTRVRLDREDAARVEPVGRRARRGEVCAQKLRRPNLAVAGDELAYLLRGEPRYPDAAQDLPYVSEVRRDGLDQRAPLRFVEPEPADCLKVPLL